MSVMVVLVRSKHAGKHANRRHGVRACNVVSVAGQVNSELYREDNGTRVQFQLTEWHVNGRLVLMRVSD